MGCKIWKISVTGRIIFDVPELWVASQPKHFNAGFLTHHSFFLTYHSKGERNEIEKVFWNRF